MVIVFCKYVSLMQCVSSPTEFVDPDAESVVQYKNGSRRWLVAVAQKKPHPRTDQSRAETAESHPSGLSLRLPAAV
jgi:hypothetical protein